MPKFLHGLHCAEPPLRPRDFENELHEKAYFDELDKYEKK